ncbi:PREDICTED: leucine-rich repeat-containing protein 4B-like [Branchiostoma belcheri]|uniref:Leucine-rich repeat-containing protein 4B-like n=1 Tax=Branchiostoma belcheri TaxID=7741 RepID=A0A6P4YD15_BRABE|nr:PREDICTED: leucine-rich repeat-containing protein 4B-like [Branchiostoma belcheri]
MKTAKFRKRRKSQLPLLTLALCLWLFRGPGVHSLPVRCMQTVKTDSHRVVCRSMALTAFPEGIPAATTTLDLQDNAFTNLTDIPQLRSLTRLLLQHNRIETVDWESLGNLPSLRTLSLKTNQITNVRLDLAVPRLPKLMTVDLQCNQLASFTKSQLGHPSQYLTNVKIQDNPYDCTCDMMWLVIDMKCLLKAGSSESVYGVCERCEACLLPHINSERFKCASPRQLKGVLLKNLAQHLTNCGNATTTATAMVNSATPGLLSAPAKTSTLATGQDGAAQTASMTEQEATQSQGQTTEQFLDQFVNASFPPTQRYDEDSSPPTSIASDQHNTTPFHNDQPNNSTLGEASAEHPSTTTTPSLKTKDHLPFSIIPQPTTLQASTVMEKSATPGLFSAPNKTSTTTTTSSFLNTKVFLRLNTIPPSTTLQASTVIDTSATSGLFSALAKTSTLATGQDGAQASELQLETHHILIMSLTAVFAVGFVSAVITWKSRSK